MRPWLYSNLKLKLIASFQISANSKARIQRPDQRGIKEKLGMAFEVAITNFFTELGTVFARYAFKAFK